ncbi:MAG: hypothetical protein V1903_10500 [Bacteroidota bacterium]
MSSNLKKILMVSLFTVSSGFLVLDAQNNDKMMMAARAKLKNWKNPLTEWEHIAKPELDSIYITKNPAVISLFFKPELSYYPFREDSHDLFLQSFSKPLGKKFRDYRIEVITNSYTPDELIPNYFRTELPVDSARFPIQAGDKPLVVRGKDGLIFNKGLSGNSAALWNSHGYYFEMNIDRWEYQRAKLFGTVEDISITGFVIPYVTRMLENAGAIVYLPRERDIQLNEVIVDNDRSTGNSEVVLHLTNDKREEYKGFLLTDTLFSGYNPFLHGTSLRIEADSVCFIPEIPEKGDYAVYVSYPLVRDNNQSVSYIINHTGGKTEYIVNQAIGGGTWIYLGTFRFNKGKNPASGTVTVKGSGPGSDRIAVDAVKFGGGMGNVARRPSGEILANQQSVRENSADTVRQELLNVEDFSWKLSGKPRFLEAARYWLQYAGMPDTLVYSPNNYKNDYNDDYQSRGFWVNYLMGDPWSQGSELQPKGLGLPVDLSLAFHTDAGITSNDSIIGTLAICYTSADDGKFPDGTSRMASRDLSDIIQTQIVDDIRKNFNPGWTRRGLWDRPYSEARRPNVPSMLLELLSHQNLADMEFGIDPRFRLAVSRSIYKGILKYLAYVQNRDFAIQPLPVSGFAITPLQGKRVRLSWNPVVEEGEPTSVPERYRICTRTGDNGFNNGFIVESTSADIELVSYDSVYSFKVTALNDGGESFNSEILSVGIRSQSQGNVLLVNGFDRISGPAWFDEGNMAGIAWWDDRGVADHYDLITLGDQYDFTRRNPWIDDDSPGWGASYSDMAGKVVPGNSFDFSYVHGKAVMAAGYSFCSVSDEYFVSTASDLSSFKHIDLIFGEEKTTPFFNDTLKHDFRIYTPEFIQKINELAEAGRNIFMSGSYVGSDLFIPGDSSAIKFADAVLHFTHRTDHAVRTGDVYSTDYAGRDFSGKIRFNTGYSPLLYTAEATDAVEPVGRGAVCAFRYSENNASAGVIFSGGYKTVILGFPFETIISEEQRAALMKQILNFFEK